ncbi:MAG: glycerophosphodiester phosphodiesterase family protein [Acetivibrio sp.]
MNEKMNVLQAAGSIILIIFLLYLLAIMPRMIKRPSKKAFLNHYYAHRGFYNNHSEAPENSMAAFRMALERKYGIELDVQLSKDGIPVVFHDEYLERVCGIKGYLKDYTYKELQTFFLYDSKETMPTFQEVLNLIDGKVPLIVEIKCEDGDTAVCRYAYELLKNYKGVYCVESFHPFAVHWFKKNVPHLVRGQLSSNFYMAGEKRIIMKALGDLLFNFYAKPDFIAYNCLYTNTLSRRLCKNLYGALPVAWTIRSQKQLETYRKEYKLFVFEGFEPK